MKKDICLYYYLKYASILYLIEVLVIGILNWFYFFSNHIPPDFVLIINGGIAFCCLPILGIIPSIIFEGDFKPFEISVNRFKYGIFCFFTFTIGPPLLYLIRYDRIVREIVYNRHSD